MVVMITKTSSPAEFLDTFVHEIHHMAEFIADEAGVSFRGEEISYIAGELALKMHKEANHWLCPRCSK